MSIGPITKSLIDCIENGDINSEKFFALHQRTDSLEKSLYDLRDKGYLTLDEGDNRILEIAATKKLLDLAKEVRQNHRQ